jgi:23S rRNA (cytidine2498-2'-O)-methyltransferase
MSHDAAQFVFMTCRPGTEAALKQEVARAEPDWRLAFSRPGFVTFKHGGGRPLDDRQLAERRWVFAHAHGISLGRLTGTQLNELAAPVWRLEGVAALAAMRAAFADIHVWQREATHEDDAGAPGETPLAQEIERAIRAIAPEAFIKLKGHATSERANARRRATPRGALVLDVAVIEPGEWCVGYHRAMSLAERWPGGAIPVPLPAHAVSRAYAKMEEALAWSGLPVAAGDECVEIGCAPGGACQALLDRGLFVTGIDPADVDPVLLSHPRFRHLKKRGKDVRRQEFVGVRWLVADMNIAPERTLDEIGPIVRHPGVALRGLVLTLKLPDWSAAATLDDLAGRVHGWGFRDVRMRQLVTGGCEVCLVALRRKALRRLGKKPVRRRVQHRKRQSGQAAAATDERRDAAHSSPSSPHF